MTNSPFRAVKHALDRPRREACLPIRWRRAMLALAIAAGLTTVLGSQIGASSAADGAETLFRSSTVHATKVAHTTRPTELGMRFNVTTPGTITGIRYFSTPTSRGVHTGSLWTGPRARIARVRLPADSTPQWRSAPFSHGVHVTPGRNYVVSYYAPHGRYAIQKDGFKARVTNGHIRASKAAGVYRRGKGGGFPNQGAGQSNYLVDVIFVPDPDYRGDGSIPIPLPTPPEVPLPIASSSAPATTTSAPPVRSAAPSTTAGPPSTAPSTSTAVPSIGGSPSTSSPDPSSSSGWPDTNNTGVPPGTTLAPYTGPCTITVDGTVIDAKTVKCDLTIKASDVTIKNSIIDGTIGDDENSNGYNFSVSDSEVRAGDTDGTGIGSVSFTATRVEVTGGNRSINCWRDCTVQDSYVHGQFKDETGTFHESGIRMGSGGTIVHNTITCDAPDVPPDAGCSASLTGYGDFAPVEDTLVQDNLFPGTTGGACAYGGSSAGKPYSDDANHIRFIGNVFEHAESGKCGVWFPITDFDPSAPGNQWTGNTWEDGTIVPAA